MSWNLNELKEAIISAYGEEQEILLNPILESIATRCIYSQYHFHQMKNLMERYFSESMPDVELLNITFNRNDNGEFDRCRMEAEANIGV